MYRKLRLGARAPQRTRTSAGPDFYRRSLLVSGTAAAAALAFPPATLAQSTARTGGDIESKFRRVSPQFIAALAAPDATSGNNAHTWGLWPLDPGPRGVRLDRYGQLQANGGVAPAQWQFDSTAWWLEEHGLIMEAPEFPLPAGRYMVTGDREATAVLRIEPMGKDGAQHWALDGGATVHDVTHLRCRSAVYTPAAGGGSCSPAQAKQGDFPVRPGAPMPPVEGCDKQDYAVLIVIGLPVQG